MNETANSNPAIARNRPKGTHVTINIKIPPENNLYKNVDKIFNNVCPATTFANNRIPNEKALARYETSSIRTNKGTNTKGVPEGTKYEKNFILCIDNPNIVTPIKIVKERLIDTIIEVVIVNEYGTLPFKLAINMKKNKEYIKGKYISCPVLPICSLTIEFML